MHSTHRPLVSYAHVDRKANIFCSVIALAALTVSSTGFAMNEPVHAWKPFINADQQFLLTSGAQIFVRQSGDKFTYALQDPTTHELKLVKDEEFTSVFNNAIPMPNQPSSSTSCPASSSTDGAPSGSADSLADVNKRQVTPPANEQTSNQGSSSNNPKKSNYVLPVGGLSRPNLITTGAAAGAGLTVTYWAKEYGFTKKQSIAAGVIATNTTSGIHQYLSRGTTKPVDRYVVASVVLQFAVDNAVYIGGQALINYVWPAKKQHAPSEANDLLNGSAQQKSSQADQPDKRSAKLVAVPTAAFAVPSLLNQKK